MNEEQYYSIALTRLTGISQPMVLQLYQALGSSQAVYEHRNDMGDVMPNATPRLREAMKNWDDALHRAAAAPRNDEIPHRDTRRQTKRHLGHPY